MEKLFSNKEINIIAKKEQESPNHYNTIDFVKFLMAISVIAIHTEPLLQYKNSNWFQYYDVFLYMAVPFFFITSSFFLFKKYFNLLKQSKEKANFALQKYIKHMTIWYLCWQIIYLPLAIIRYNIENVIWWKAILCYTRDLLLVGGRVFSSPLWYLLSSLYAALLLNYLLNKGWNKQKIIVCSIFVYTIANYITNFVAGLESYTGIQYQIAKIIKITISNGRLMSGFLFFSIGMYLSNLDSISKFKLVYCLPTLILSFIGSAIYGYSLFKVILYISYFLIIINLHLPENKVYYILRKFSIYLYLLHMLYYSIWTYTISGWNNRHGVESFFFTLSFALLTGIFIYFLQKRYNWPWLKTIFN